jgi:chromosome segregation ATPase
MDVIIVRLFVCFSNSNAVQHPSSFSIVVKLKEEMFKKSQELFEHRSKEANLIAEISGAQASAKNLNHKIHTLDQESLRQQELVYNAEFQIQQMERKVARAGGERSDEEKIALNAKIKEVTKVLDETKEQSRMLKHQCKKVIDELTVSKRKLVDIKEARKKGEAAIAELQLINDAAVKTLKEHNKEQEEFMVRHDVLKLEVKHLRDQLHGHADEVFGLANRKFQLEQSMEERKHEIKVHRDVQRAAFKASNEERHRVAMEARDRQTKVLTLKSKYESLVAAARPSDGGGEEKSQAYFIIQAAQKREELQREGDELDGKIRRAEREMKALENTLKHLNDRNTKFRLSFHKADPNSKEAKECRSLEAQMKVTKDHLFKKRKELQRLTSDYEEDTRRHRQMERQGQQLQAHLEHLQDAHGQVDNELREQMDKHSSTVAKVEDAAIEHRRAKGVADDYETLEEKNFTAEGLKETNANVLYTLGQLAREFPEMRDTLQAVLSSQALDIPSRPPSRISRGSSRASYRTASRGASRGGDQTGL